MMQRSMDEGSSTPGLPAALSLTHGFTTAGASRRDSSNFSGGSKALV
jgi:hypothetical protein